MTYPLKIADSSRGLSAIAELLVVNGFRGLTSSALTPQSKLCDSDLWDVISWLKACRGGTVDKTRRLQSSGTLHTRLLMIPPLGAVVFGRCLSL